MTPLCRVADGFCVVRFNVEFFLSVQCAAVKLRGKGRKTAARTGVRERGVYDLGALTRCDCLVQLR